MNTKPIRRIQKSHPSTDEHGVLTVSNLTCTSMDALLNNDALAIRVPHFCSEEVRQRLLRIVDEKAELTPYTHEVRSVDGITQKFFGVYRIGTPFNLTYGKPHNDDIHRQYDDDGHRAAMLFAKTCLPNSSPIAKLSDALADAWNEGVTMAAFAGRPLHAGILRIMLPETSSLSETTPHVDALPPDLKSMAHQLSANVYLQTPDEGGELIIYKHGPLTVDEIGKLQEGRLDPDWLRHRVRISPQAGELMLFNTRRPHAIAEFPKGRRVSMQTFMAVDPCHPIRLWC